MMRCCYCCCSCQTALIVLGLILAIFLGLCHNASLEVQQPCCQPFKEESSSSSPRISLFQNRPSDGGNLEWFQYGATSDNDADPIVWIFIHGAVSTGGVLEIFPDFDQRMKEMNVRVIAPTMPGWGSSDGYEPVFDISNQEWLERWRQDSLALVTSLGIDHFWVSGMSLGGPPALALAEVAQREHRLLGIAPLISSMWNHDGFDLVTTGELSFVDRNALAALVNPYLGSFAAKLMRYAILRSSKEDFRTSPMVPPHVGWDREKWGLDLQRAVRYQLSGQVQSNRLAALATTSSSPTRTYTDAPKNTNTVFIDWSVFTEEVPVYIFYGESDDIVHPMIATFAATKLPWAKRMPFPGGHFDLDIFAVAATMFASATRRE